MKKWQGVHESKSCDGGERSWACMNEQSVNVQSISPLKYIMLTNCKVILMSYLYKLIILCGNQRLFLCLS